MIKTVVILAVGAMLIIASGCANPTVTQSAAAQRDYEELSGTWHPAGHFTVNPDTRPKQVDSIAEGGPNAGEMTPGIYEILDANHKRACWGPPGGPRPTEFESPPGSKRILQYWKKIGPVPSH